MSSAFASSPGRREPVTSATIQKMLDENTQLIQAVIDHQNQGEAKKCAQYQQILHRNLVFLATIADSNMNSQTQVQSSNVGGGMHMQQSGNAPGSMNPNMNFRQTNMATVDASIQGNMASSMSIQTMQADIQGMQGNVPNIQGNMQNLQSSVQSGNMASMQGNVTNTMQNIQGSFPGMQGNMPNGISGNMQSMQSNLGNISSNLQNNMQGNISMQSNDIMTMQQGMPNMTVNNQNEIQNSLMIQQRSGMQNLQGMQFQGAIQPNLGGF